MPFDFDLRAFLQDPQVEGLLRILLAGVLAALVGLEREMEGKPAGIRTYGLVGMGAATFTIVGTLVFGPGDPASRVGQGIVTGIGFIGAGTILQMKRHIIGLTTAAGLWVAAAIGMAVGGGLYILGIGGAVLVFLLLQFLRPEILVRFGLATQEDVEGRVVHAPGEQDASGREN
jgi:putative Mg2+ transporter-C (MgtC) family protein